MAYNTIEFAKQELNKYLDKLGVCADVSLEIMENADVPDPKFDDAFKISVKDRKGYIAGSNERSVLFGVYRLIERWGVRWVRPGKNGTFYPAVCDACDVEVYEKASKRHRTMCIEGALKLENVLDMVEWIPKMGFNSYFIQFDNGHAFYDNFYSRRNNPTKEPEILTPETASEYTVQITAEIKKRGLMLHKMGHGWTCRPFGIKCEGWEVIDPETLPASYLDVCALINGKRQTWKNMPSVSQLCYSNPYVGETIANAMIDYFIKNPEVDVIHFWLGDGYNNYCECEECKKHLPSDLYVKMANTITDKMEAAGLDKLIVLDCCYNAAMPPVEETLKHPEKIIVMFAPISRTFAESFPNGFRKTHGEPFEYNKFTNPRSVDANLAYLCDWEKYYSGNIVDFDYHLMWDHILDAGNEGIARVIYDDVRNLESLGMNGYISCQLQRNSFPTAIAMTVMGKTLWNNDTDFDTVRKELYAASFGEDMTDTMCEYFSTLSKGFDIGSIRAQKPCDKVQFKKDLLAALDAIENMKPVINAHLNESDPCRRECWSILPIHAELYTLIGKAILARLDGDIEKSDEIRAQATLLAWQREDEIQGMLDCLFFEQMTRTRITPEKDIAFSDMA